MSVFWIAYIVVGLCVFRFSVQGFYWSEVGRHDRGKIDTYKNLPKSAMLAATYSAIWPIFITLFFIVYLKDMSWPDFTDRNGPGPVKRLLVGRKAYWED